MYRRLGSKHLFQKIGRLFFFTRMRPGQNDRKHPLLVLLSVLCKSLQRSLIFIALPFSACALFGKAGAKVRCFFIPSKCFERKVCESWRFFALFYKTRVKRGCFWGKGRKKGKAVVKERTVYICHYREISAPLSFNYFLLIIYRGLERRKGRAGWAKKGGGRRKKPRLPSPEKAQKPAPILRDGLGIRSGWKAVRGQVDFSCKRSDLVIARRLGSKVGLKMKLTS